MAYWSIDLPGPSIEAGDMSVTAVARLTEVGFTTASYGAGFQYFRPVRLEVRENDGTLVEVPIPDRTFQIRLLALAVVVAAYIIGRLR